MMFEDRIADIDSKCKDLEDSLMNGNADDVERELKTLKRSVALFCGMKNIMISSDEQYNEVNRIYKTVCSVQKTLPYLKEKKRVLAEPRLQDIITKLGKVVEANPYTSSLEDSNKAISDSKQKLNAVEKEIAHLEEQKENLEQKRIASENSIDRYITTIMSDMGNIAQIVSTGESIYENQFDSVDNNIDKLAKLKDYFSTGQNTSLQGIQKYISALFEEVKTKNAPKTISVRFENILERINDIIHQPGEPSAISTINERLKDLENQKKMLQKQIVNETKILKDRYSAIKAKQKTKANISKIVVILAIVAAVAAIVAAVAAIVAFVLFVIPWGAILGAILKIILIGVCIFVVIALIIAIIIRVIG